MKTKKHEHDFNQMDCQACECGVWHPLAKPQHKQSKIATQVISHTPTPWVLKANHSLYPTQHKSYMLETANRFNRCLPDTCSNGINCQSGRQMKKNLKKILQSIKEYPKAICGKCGHYQSVVIPLNNNDCGWCGECMFWELV